MSKRAAKGLLTIVFVALLGAPVLLRHLPARSETSALDEQAALDRYGFYLEEVSEKVGIDFNHQAPQLDSQLEHIMPQVASMGAAVSVVDYDQDGWQDLYVTNSRQGSKNALYRNLGDGTFQDVASKLGIANVNRSETGVSMGAVWGDYDNDGYEDLFLYKWGRSELYHNDKGEGFTRVTEKANLPEWANVNAGIWLDYNRDGNLDLFFSGYYREEINLWDLASTRIMPESFEYARNGGRKYLLKGRGDGTFEDVTELLGQESGRWTMAISSADLTGNGYPDLYLANDYGVDELFLNKGGGHFQPAGEETGIGFAPKSGMNVAFGDILNQGQYAIYVTNISEKGVLIQGNNLWVPTSGQSENLTYQNMAGAMGVEMGGWSYGAQFGDLNNSGTLDLFMTNGYVSAKKGSSYWYDFSKIAGGNKAIISDAENWPAMEGRSLSGHQRKRLWLNDGTGHFQEVAQAVGVNTTYDGRAVALVDLWNRGVLDVVVAHQRGPLLVYKNTVGPDNQWIAFDLEGRESNRSAIGARVELFWNGQRQAQTMRGGSGFSAQNQRRLHFGLGSDPEVQKAVVHWPSGKTQTLPDPETGKVHEVVEPS